MIRVFAPGVIKLFGEHAVVYGQPAIATAVDRGAWVLCERGERTVIRAGPAQAQIEYDLDGDVAWARGHEPFLSYVKTALRKAGESFGPLKASFEVKNDFPPSVGAATSASVSVAILKAYSACLGVDVSGEELARLAHKVELEVQGAASPMDTAVSALGGVLRIETSPFRYRRLATPIRELVLAVLPRRGTTKEIVAEVRGLKSRHKSIDAVIEAIGKIADEAEECLSRGDLVCLGELMEVNNWLLGALSVVGHEVVLLLHNLRPYIYGGKISGAGRGGVVVLLPKDAERLAEALKSMGIQHYHVRIDEGGARLV
ncbi:mevalonate kinase [Thermoproteus tenax]|uniref:Mevalonate kinase n=1 Tax=Thermoproteus tenax (strain ATCC 35583 / DSM 2078 / JCM 9277 / NBRC 100435 / Kra 1) TaxID=768679 RepID=G4RLH9_THETK|nr:mevalonate kinase [Thermoproteus tenax]CCC82424.1 Mevalonate kinase [Thermoproteus tenax Kra 1]